MNISSYHNDPVHRSLYFVCCILCQWPCQTGPSHSFWKLILWSRVALTVMQNYSLWVGITSLTYMCLCKWERLSNLGELNNYKSLYFGTAFHYSFAKCNYDYRMIYFLFNAFLIHFKVTTSGSINLMCLHL